MSLLSDAQQLERHLLRRSVTVLAQRRHTCTQCRRTPLAGEYVHLYEHGRVVCELCSGSIPALPLASQVVRHTEYGHTVRLTARAA
jgi:hypothetical protein